MRNFYPIVIVIVKKICNTLHVWSTRLTTQHQDWHLTTEQFSAYLDAQLASDEQARCEAHLRTCTRCQQELASLRATTMLLQAMPTPPLPRSFVFSSAQFAAAQQEDANGDEQARTPLPLQRRRSSTFFTALRAVSGLAAAVGVFFLLSSLLNPMGGVSNMATSSGGTSSALHPYADASVSASANNQTATSKTPSVEHSVATATTPGNQISTIGSPHYPPTPLLVLPDLSTATGRALVGLILLICGLLGLFLLRRRPATRGP